MQYLLFIALLNFRCCAIIYVFDGQNGAVGGVFAEDKSVKHL